VTFPEWLLVVGGCFLASFFGTWAAIAFVRWLAQRNLHDAFKRQIEAINEQAREARKVSP
jgi:hypothetical protein